MSKTVKIAALGGYGEIGKNMTALEYKGSIIIIDSGIAFSSEKHPGINCIIPKIDYLIQNKHKIKGIIITHGHEDHIGALPFILDKLNYPRIYCKRLTMELIKSKLDERSINYNDYKIITNKKNKVHLGSISVEFVHVNHSILDSSALYVKCGKNKIFFSGDFKLDYTPVKEDVIDLNRIAKIGDMGVDLFVVDTTNAHKKGLSYSEKEVGVEINNIISGLTGRAIIATFSTNLTRIIQVLKIAKENDRKVVILGRSLDRIISIASDINYIDINKYDLISKKDIDKYDEDELIFLVTGSQGEKYSVLRKASRDRHNFLNLKKSDTVLISAKVIPGNEVTINNLINDLHRRVKEVIYEKVSEIHVSGHASQEDIKLITNLLKPKYVAPVHGEYKHINAFYKLMKFMGYKDDNIKLIENGDMLKLKKSRVKHFKNEIPYGSIYIENREIGFINKYTLNERKIMKRDGVMFILVSFDKETRKVYYGPELIYNGIEFSDKFVLKMENKIVNVLNDLEKKEVYNEDLLKKRIRRRLRRFIRKRVYKEPYLVVKILEE